MPSPEYEHEEELPEQLKSHPLYRAPSNGQRVIVLDENGRELFRGTMADTSSPWAFWHRVVPDGPHIDLPPKYKVVEERATEGGTSGA